MEWNEKDERRNDNERKWKKWKGNRIGFEGAKSLSEALKFNSSLTSLDLSGDENEMKCSKKVEEMETNR